MEERTIKLSLDKAKEYYEAEGELRKIALKAYRKDELCHIELPRTYEEYISQLQELGYSISFLMENMGHSIHAVAFDKLRHLRRCYRQDWIPDWSNEKQTKYCIVENDGLEVGRFYQNRQFLAFQTQELAEQFLDNFRDLIIKADIL